MADTRFEELERRVRELASDAEGEKMVTRHVLDQCRRNGAEIAAVRVELQTIGLRIDNLTGDVTEARAALNRLNVISQDVTALRGETIAIRRDMNAIREEIHRDMNAMREEIRRDMDAMREEIGRDMDTTREEAAARHNELLAAIRALASGAAPSA